MQLREVTIPCSLRPQVSGSYRGPIIVAIGRHIYLQPKAARFVFLSYFPLTSGRMVTLCLREQQQAGAGIHIVVRP